MKKLGILLLAAGLLLGSAPQCRAINFDVKGSWQFAFDYINGGNFMIHRAYRYAPDYPGLKGRDLSVKTPLLPGYPKFFEIWKPAAAK